MPPCLRSILKPADSFRGSDARQPGFHGRRRNIGSARRRRQVTVPRSACRRPYRPAIWHHVAPTEARQPAATGHAYPNAACPDRRGRVARGGLLRGRLPARVWLLPRHGAGADDRLLAQRAGAGRLRAAVGRGRGWSVPGLLHGDRRASASRVDAETAHRQARRAVRRRGVRRGRRRHRGGELARRLPGGPAGRGGGDHVGCVRRRLPLGREDWLRRPGHPWLGCCRPCCWCWACRRSARRASARRARTGARIGSWWSGQGGRSGPSC
ncbi:hypothetical protein SAMN05192580_3622 [Sphingomonas jatrophae]|uniref:Uncharacterized protein n=1 Tax=Sphingomonas jatrophae TaxID=1166337 RepID=A0A1I6M847_9SPHN|nr:hypothetical protein SAMN05192580_3622 [Sphingomonas jatrophae]